MNNENNLNVVALVGPIAAGKGTVAKIFIENGYVAFNYGDEIYKERTRRGLKEERKNSHAVALLLREEFGNEIIAIRLAEVINQYDWQKKERKILIDGLRHPDEVKWVKKNLMAKVLGVTAALEIRYQRALKRNAIVDPKSPEGFYEIDGEDRGIDPGLHGNHTDGCIQIADIVIENNGEDIEEYKNTFYESCSKIGVDIKI